MSEPIIRIHTEADCTCRNQHPELDEFIGRNVNIHFEMMGQSQFWLGVTDPATGRTWHLRFGAVNPAARGYSACEEDSPVPVAALGGSS